MNDFLIKKDCTILDGKKTAEKIKCNLKQEVELLEKKPQLAVILVGKDNSSQLYVAMKEKACKEIGIVSYKFNFLPDVDEKQLLKLIENLNDDPKINGILVQLPLPKQINKKRVVESISPLKDVDGFHSQNVGGLHLGKECFVPCTPKGIIKLLDEYGIDIVSKDIVIVGRSDIVGKPLIPLLLGRDATVTICHSKTKNLKEKTLRADIIISATGISNMIKEDMVKEDVVIIDVGMNRIEVSAEEKGRYKGHYLCGDVDFEKVKTKASYITPVPKGIGPMTIAMLLENTLKAYRLQNNVENK